MDELQLSLLIGLLIVGLVGELGSQLIGKIYGDPKEQNKRLISPISTVTSFSIFTFLSLAVLFSTLGITKQTAIFTALFGLIHSIAYVAFRKLSGWPKIVLKTLVHTALALAIWILATSNCEHVLELISKAPKNQSLLIILAYLVVIWPMSSVVGTICGKWAESIPSEDSLPLAGAWIGILERVLILTFILADQFAAIGFLLAAKSILRFGSTAEKDHRKLTEYVLIGTMTSFALTILFGLGVRFLIGIFERAESLPGINLF